MHSRLLYSYMKANIKAKEQSDLGSYCFTMDYQNKSAVEKADDYYHEWEGPIKMINSNLNKNIKSHFK